MKLCDFEVGLDHPLFLMAGPCVIESEQMALDTAAELQQICATLGIPFIYKSSFDKASESSSLNVGKISAVFSSMLFSRAPFKRGAPRRVVSIDVRISLV